MEGRTYPQQAEKTAAKERHLQKKQRRIRKQSIKRKIKGRKEKSKQEEEKIEKKADSVMGVHVIARLSSLSLTISFFDYHKNQEEKSKQTYTGIMVNMDEDSQ